MSLIRPVSVAAAMPRHSPSSHTRSSSACSGAISPTATVIAASPCQPSTTAPQSMETTSPSRITRSPGMPCTISSFTDVHSVAGKSGTPGPPGTPMKDGMPPARRMFSSAIASRSLVVIPGAIVALSNSRVSPTSNPATRIFWICSGVLYSIIRSRLLNISASGAVAAQCGNRSFGDVLHRSGGVHSDQDAGFGVIPDDRCGLLRVYLQPMPDGLLAVVVALEELPAAAVAGVRVDGGVEVQVPDRAALAAGAPTGQPTHHLVVVDHQLHHHVQPVAQVEQHVVEHLGLGQVAREAVEQVPRLGVRLTDPVAHHGDGDLVGDQIPGVHVFLRLGAQRGALADVGPEDVTRRDLGDGQVRRDESGLSPLSGPRRPDQDDA